MSTYPDLSGKLALITGASRGIGAGLAAEFAGHNMRLALCARSQPVAPSGSDSIVAAVDVRDHMALERFAQDTEDRFGAIDLWINNAGILNPIAPLRDTEPEAIAEHMEINVLGVFNGCRAFINHRKKNGGGGILVNISSGAGRRGYFGWSAYCAGKAAVDRLTECIALEEKDSKLRAYSIAPGIVDTFMQEQIRSSSERDFPEVGRFVALKADEKFSSTAWVAEQLLERVFGAGSHPGPDDPDEVLVSLPLEHQL